MKTATRLALGGTLVAALAAGTLGFAVARAQERPAEEKTAPDYGALVKSLGHEKFAERTKAYEALESAGASARAALEEGAKSEDEQIRWSAKRLLGRLEDGKEPERGVLRFREPRRIEIRDLGGSLDDMDRRLQDLGRRLGDLRELRTGLRLELAPMAPGAVDEHRYVSVDDGERLEVRKDATGRITGKISTKGADGKATEETFEAKDMATLEKERPEVAKKLKGWEEVRLFGPTLLLPEKPALGVMISPVPDVLRSQLSVKDGEGVVVEEVLPDTAAARLGLQRHDVVLSINGTPVGDARSIRAAVEAVKEGGELKVRILRGGKAEELTGTR
jgi:hypothetical protein